MCRYKKYLSLLIILLCFFLSACEEIPPTPTPENDTGWYSLYFSKPTSPNTASYRNGPDVALATAIAEARVSVDAAIYDLNLWSIRNALISAHRRGVTVRVVAESDNLEQKEIQELIEEGIKVLGNHRYGAMHNKFVVIDRYEVWTGSMNFTFNGAYHNDNNLIRIRSSPLAEVYLTEFEEMFILNLFGDASPANTPNAVVTIEGTQVEVLFSPDDGTQARIVELIHQAEKSIYFLAFTFTADAIADALLEADQRGVEVVGVVETSQASGTGGEFFRLADAGMAIELDGNPKNMHHKVMIIDGEIVILGSYNFSASAEEKNDENTLIIHNVEIAEVFLVEFKQIYEMRQ